MKDPQTCKHLPCFEQPTQLSGILHYGGDQAGLVRADRSLAFDQQAELIHDENTAGSLVDPVGGALGQLLLHSLRFK